MPKEDQDDVLLRIVASLAQQTIIINGTALPSGKINLNNRIPYIMYRYFTTVKN